MVRWQGLKGRSNSGARIKQHREKRKYEMGRPESQTTIGLKRVRKIRARGGNIKNRPFRLEFCNLVDPATGKAEQAKIITVQTNPANKEYTRRNIITKGALLRTDKGYAIVTNRPGQEGFISAITTQFDVEQSQQRTLSVKKRKRQTLLIKRAGSAAGTQKKPSKEQPKKVEEKVVEKAPAKPEEKAQPKKDQPEEEKKAPAKKPTPVKAETKTEKEVETKKEKPKAKKAEVVPTKEKKK